MSPEDTGDGVISFITRQRLFPNDILGFFKCENKINGYYVGGNTQCELLRTLWGKASNHLVVMKVEDFLFTEGGVDHDSCNDELLSCKVMINHHQNDHYSQRPNKTYHMADLVGARREKFTPTGIPTVLVFSLDDVEMSIWSADSCGRLKVTASSYILPEMDNNLLNELLDKIDKLNMRRMEFNDVNLNTICKPDEIIRLEVISSGF